MLKKNISIAAVALAMAASSAHARDWVWEDSFRMFETGAVKAAVAPEHKDFAKEHTGTRYGQWQFATAPKGLTVWISDHCERFIEAMGIDQHTSIGTCGTTVFLINGRDIGQISVGDRWLLPSLQNDPATIQANFEAASSDEARQTAEGQPITRVEAQAMLSEVMVTLNLDERSQKYVVDEIGRQLETFTQNYTVPAEVVRDSIAVILAERAGEFNLIGKEVFDGALQAVNDRLKALEDFTAAGGALDQRIGDAVNPVVDRVTDLAADTKSVQSSIRNIWIGLSLALAVIAIVGYRIYRKAEAARRVADEAKSKAEAASDGVKQRVNSLTDRVDDHANRLAAIELSIVKGRVESDDFAQLAQLLQDMQKQKAGDVRFNMKTGQEVILTYEASRDQAGFRLSVSGAGDLTSLDPKKKNGEYGVSIEQLRSAIITAENAGAFDVSDSFVWTGRRDKGVAHVQ